MNQKETSVVRMHWGICLLVAVTLCLLEPLAAIAQLPTATVLGVVEDATGAVVPDAALTARNVNTGQTRIVVSDGNGSYRFSALPVGTYEIHVEHPGFQSEERTGLTLTVGLEAVMNFTLQVGAIEQTVSVTAEAPLVNTTSGSLGGLVDEQRVADLPLNGRNYVDLTLLQTGIAQHKNTGSGTSQYGSWFSSNGAPVRSNTFLLDGANMASFSGATSAAVTSSTLGTEGIREFRVITNSFSAEYGLTMGSQMTIVSKGGTNTYHGSLLEYLRNSALDARNFFDYKTETTPRRLPSFTRNQFGASFGGPLREDRTFFHVVYEGIRERLGRTNNLTTIPSSAKVDGGLVPQIAPIVKPWLALYPEPNLPGNRFTFPFSQPTTEDYGQIRVDQTFSDNDTLFVRYTFSDTDIIFPRGFPQFKDIRKARLQYVTLSESHIFSPTLLNTFRFSFSRTNPEFESPSEIIGPEFSFVAGEEFGGVSISGISRLAPNGIYPSLQKQNIYTLSDDMFYTRGRHALKFGTLINRYQRVSVSGTGGRGSISFLSLTNFLLAQSNRISALTPGSLRLRTVHHHTLGFYVQDAMRVRPNFTLNLGLRYEFHTELKEPRGRATAIRDIRNDPEPTLGRLMENPSLGNISPRFGFAWDVTGNAQTAVRGGFGLLYDIAAVGTAMVQSVRTPPFSTNSQVRDPETFTLPFIFPPESAGLSMSTTDYRIQQPHLLQYHLTVERQLPYQMAMTLAYGGSRGINLLQTLDGNPPVPEILPDGRKRWPVNATRCCRTSPHWDSVNYFTAGSSSWYNSLQFSLTKRLSKGLQFQSSYTWAKVLDNTQGLSTTENRLISGSKASDPSDITVDKGPSVFDIAHNWRFNAIYRLPQITSGGASAKLLNGWWTSGILSMQTGYAFSPSISGSRSGSNSGEERPDLLPGRNNSNIILGGPDHYFDSGAFAISERRFLGNAGRGILRGPGFATLDFSLAKDTALGFLGESGKLQFRAEIFNIFNRVNFGIPSRNTHSARRSGEAAKIPLATAGRISGTVGTSRQIQLALKILF